MDVKAYNNYVNEVVYPAISKCSLGLAIIVLLTMIILSIYDFKLVDRVTLRLQTGVTCYDIWLHSLPLWNRPYNYEGSPLCTFIAYQLFSFPLFYCFLNAAIGLNLQLIFLHNIKVTREIELRYWLGTVGLTLLITLPPLAMGVIGFGSYDQCYIASSDETYGKLLNFFTNVFIMILCMIYLLTIVILVSFQHYRQINRIRKQGEVYGDSLSKKDIKQISRLISRM
ncbi:hypothetical protein K502DRAFT_179813 [Neoconidiobolus thromboides FSU 785]|nr:hypothetical protein K502DRAFT_179813 [Neoconidiobolus thromboides FSU 785]